MSKIKQEEYYLWQSIVIELNKDIDYCLKQLKQRSIQTHPPEQFEEKKNNIKFILHDNENIEEEEFLDVFAYMLEERINVSLLELADQFTQNFGKDATFWTNKITQWVNLMTFTNNLVIWTVTEFMRNFINYTSNPIQRDLIHQWRPKVQAYLSSIDFLIRKIKKIKKTDSAFILDDAYLKYHKEKVLYFTFINKFGFGLKPAAENSNSYYQENTITFQNKSKAEKKLFNFPHATKTLDDIQSFGGKNSKPNPKRSINTLEKYNFLKKKNSGSFSAQKFETTTDQEQLLAERHKNIEILQKIGKNNTDEITSLRDELKNEQQIQKQQQKRQQESFQNSNLTKSSRKIHSIDSQSHIYQVLELQSFQASELKRYPMLHGTYIHNPQDYFSFEGQPIGQRGISVSNPFIMFQFVNYYINDYEEYDEIMAISLGNSFDGEDSDTEFEDSENQVEGINDDSGFIDYRLIVTNDENVDIDILPPEDRMNFAQLISEQRIRWIAHSKCPEGEQALSLFSCIPIYGTQLPYLIDGIDDSKSKRKSTKEKNHNMRNKGQLDPIQVIVEAIEQDISTTIVGIRRQNQTERTNYDILQYQDENKKQISILDDQTTFEQLEYRQIKCLSQLQLDTHQNSNNQLLIRQNSHKKCSALKSQSRKSNSKSKSKSSTKNSKKKDNSQTHLLSKNQNDQKDVQI